MSDRFVYLIAILFSILISTWIAANANVINPDAICYVLSAEAIVKSGFSDAMQLCPQAKWPLYSLLIYGFAQLTHLSYVTSAYILDGFYTLISVVMFIAIIKALGGTRRVLWLAALVILCAHQFNSVRQYIIRDHGFWAFYLMSIWFLLRYFRDFKLMSALCWSASLLVATLFRIEGIIFLLLLPFLSWCHTQLSLRQRAFNFLTLNAPALIIGIILTGLLLLYSAHPLEKLGRINEVIQQIQYGFVLLVNRFDVIKLALNTYALPPEAVRDTGLVLTLMLVTWYLVSVINNLSWIYAALVGYAWSTRAATFTRTALLVLGGYLVINLCITAAFFGENLYLSKRYLIALTLVLMFWVPFALDRLWSKTGRSRITFWLAIVLMLGSTVGVFIIHKDSKTYVYESGLWLANNVPVTATLYANSQQLRFYSNHYKPRDVFKSMELSIVAQGKWKQYDYVAFVVDQADATLRAVIQEIPFAPIQTFMNARGDKVVIYKIQH